MLLLKSFPCAFIFLKKKRNTRLQTLVYYKMPETLTFTLEKQAKNIGADKYVCTEKPEFNMYVPQNISRENGIPKKTLNITIS